MTRFRTAAAVLLVVLGAGVLARITNRIGRVAQVRERCRRANLGPSSSSALMDSQRKTRVTISLSHDYIFEQG